MRKVLFVAQKSFWVFVSVCRGLFPLSLSVGGHDAQKSKKRICLRWLTKDSRDGRCFGKERRDDNAALRCKFIVTKSR